MVSITTKLESIRTGFKEMDDRMGGGIRVNSLALIEGRAEAGKSTLSQYLAYIALRSRENAIAYYTTEYSIRGLIAQMDSLSLYVLDEFLTDWLRIYPLGLCNSPRVAEKSFRLLANHFSKLPERFNLVIVDSLTLLMTHTDPVATLDFLFRCKELCTQGRSIILLASSHAFQKETLSRTYALCDYYLKLRSEEIGNRLIRILEVPKLRGVDYKVGEGVSFEIEPEVGIRVVPVAKVKASA